MAEDTSTYSLQSSPSRPWMTAEDVTGHLPVHLIKSNDVPPAPTWSKPGSEAPIDWLLDFSGYSWIAYGASSLLVIRHFPNPLSESETGIGSIFQQTIELSGDISVVSWSPATPSCGDLAAASNNCIGLFSCYLDNSSSRSFCWSQRAILVQSTKVENIKWSGSGDGIISGGIEVILWRKKEKSWEIAWKFKPSVPQALVTASWSIGGPSATAPLSKLQTEVSSPLTDGASKCVLVCQIDLHAHCMQAKLQHPLPVTMIQWRPSTGKPSNRGVRQTPRSVLLTCCLDGALRLWSEIDDGRIRRTGKDSSDQKGARLIFHVVATIEINQTLNGYLGSNIFVSWATEVEGILSVDNRTRDYSRSENLQHDIAGRCEWLIGFGPQRTATFWAIHCLDDFVPLRFPRVTLWKRQEFIGLAVEASRLLLKVFIMRNQVSGPPVTCSLAQLSPGNDLTWIELHSRVPTGKVHESADKYHAENFLSSYVKGTIKIDGHTGKILQLAVHPSLFEVEVAASLDTNGILLLWSLPTLLFSHMSLSTLKAPWRLCRRIVTSDQHLRYTCLCWAPVMIDEHRVLLVGHAGGIDLFMVRALTNEEEKIICQKLLTIPLKSRIHEQGPVSVHSLPLPSTSKENIASCNFLFVALWMHGFEALSWEITIHYYDSEGSCGHKANDHIQIFRSEFAGGRYCVSVHCWSSVLPVPDENDKVTSFAVVCPIQSFLCDKQKWSSISESSRYYDGYHMITGSVNGTVKLWRSSPATSLGSSENWDLVGVLVAHQGPILVVSPSACGRMIATVSGRDQSENSSAIYIWECMRILNAGSFVLEDKLNFDGEVVALNWFRTGNGQFLLGFCLQNELRVYARSRSGSQDILKSEKALNRNIWICISVNNTGPVICNFLWGHRGNIIVVHHGYFCLFNQFLLFIDKKVGKDGSSVCNGPFNRSILATIFTDSGKSLMRIDGRQCEPQLSANTYKGDDFVSVKNIECPEVYNPVSEIRFWSMLDISEKMGGCLPVFHPEALLVNVSSGNWKRAYIALRHLNQHLISNNFSERSYQAKTSSIVIPPVPLSNYLEGLLSSESSERLFKWNADSILIGSSLQFQEGLSQYPAKWDCGSSHAVSMLSSSRSEIIDFAEAVEKLYKSAYITAIEKLQTLAVIDLLQEVTNPQSTSAYASLDEPGRRFWVAVRYMKLFFVRRFSRLPLVEESVVPSGLIAWAFHSDCQENLFTSLLSAEPSWEEMRTIGIGFWYTNEKQLRLKMERLARQQYLKNKDPKACTLLYIALNRLQVLAGLFKLSKDEKDKPLVGFLSRNFQEDKNKAAALKNAYVLMGKHQLELAVAFFLLGGDASSAITVCAKNLGDEQLALVICRLVEGNGGPLERHLISKALLPSAIAKGDHWLASLLEWMLGNYSQAFLKMLGCQMGLQVNTSILSSAHISFLDPSIGQYCVMLASKTSMKNSIGEHNAVILSRWAVLMNATALSRCGLPLEAMECVLSLASPFSGSTQGSTQNSLDQDPQLEALKPSLNTTSSNWISDGVAGHLVYDLKVDLIMQHLSKLLRDHPSWLGIDKTPFGRSAAYGYENQDLDRLLKSFNENLTVVLAYCQQNFSLIPQHLIDMIVLYMCNNGLEFIGYYILNEHQLNYQSPEKTDGSANFDLYGMPSKQLQEVTEEIADTLSKYIVSACANGSGLACLPAKSMAEHEICLFIDWEFTNQSVFCLLRCLRAILQLLFRTCTKDSMEILLSILGLFEYFAFFSSAWLKRNDEALLKSMKPVFIALSKGRESCTIKLEDLEKLLIEIAEVMAYDTSLITLGSPIQIKGLGKKKEQDGVAFAPMPDDPRWWVVSVSLWQLMSNFLDHQLDSLQGRICYSASEDLVLSKTNQDFLQSHVEMVLNALVKSLKVTFSHISSYCAKTLSAYLLEAGVSHENSPLCTENCPSKPSVLDRYFGPRTDNCNVVNTGDELSASEILWQIGADPKIINGAFAQENLNWLSYFKPESSIGWSDAYRSITRVCETEETSDQEDKLGSPHSAVGSPLACLSPDDHPFKSSGGNNVNHPKRVAPFHHPRELYKRNGELLEALCINSIDQHQVALASNRKGIIFFNWEDELPHRDKSEYIWAEADWPHNGWAGCDSIPIPTCVSPGVGLGSKKGTHLGLGGATIGAGPLARPGRDLIGGGAFGIPGYAGVGASALGWGLQEDFDEFVDPPATLENVRTRAFSTHPSRPLFLVGSSNTHVYLWEFGKDRATATYGVLPAANIPPPYALASVSAVHFDHCGHRFVTAGLDGTVCTWQLEVGGRSNICPTESSVCFSNHTSDVTYITASGSIVAAAGYSSNGVNVVLWDTLAPPATSQASIMCHEGGARFLSVFDNDIGSGSISPLIVTGGKAGDVGLHDFRYIATGKSKRHKHLDIGDHHINTSSTVDMQNKTGDQNRNGMLWYIPKAHSASITKISTIPHTSFFLTGSKDGDVKLWDAKRARLIFHWPRLHERHTFLQPSSRGFGGVVRAAVTDIQVVSHGFLTCGGDGFVKLVKFGDLIDKGTH